MRPAGSLSPDARALLAVQALRAAAYGLGSVLIGVSLARGGLSAARVGLVLGAVLAGAALVSLALARYGDRLGRRRAYRVLIAAMGAAGAVFAFTSWLPALVLAALTGTVSTDVLESGPLTSLEQAMLPSAAAGRDGGTTRLFGLYNTVAVLAGSLGALAAGLPALLGTGPQRWLLAYPAAAALASLPAARLSAAVEPSSPSRGALGPSRGIVVRLSGLFALDSFGGGFAVQAFVAYWLTRKFHASPGELGALFFGMGLLQALSFQVAVRLARRIGLLRTMVLTHLPSNALLAAVAFAPSLGVAVALLLARVLLSQMDVPARQAFVVGVVGPDERIAAAAYTNTARYVTRPFAPLLAGALVPVSLGLPFVVAGALKSIYDIGLWTFFRKVEPELD